jgi:RHS repeat-associated protein
MNIRVLCVTFGLLMPCVAVAQQCESQQIQQSCSVGINNVCCGSSCCYPGWTCYPDLPCLSGQCSGLGSGNGLCCSPAQTTPCATYQVSPPTSPVWGCCKEDSVCTTHCNLHSCWALSDLEGDCAPGKPPCDKCNETGDPVDVWGGGSKVRVVDVEVPGSVTRLRFERAWTSDLAQWADDSPLRDTPKPFGGSPYAVDAPEWTHNFLSMVTWTGGSQWSVRTPEGNIRRYNNCTGFPCWASPAAGNTSVSDRLQRTSSSFVLVRANGERLVYATAFARTALDGGTTPDTTWFLTSILNAAGITTHALTYAQPQGVTCPAANVDAGSYPGAPYISQIQTPESLLKLDYAALQPDAGLADGGGLAAQCVIRHVYLVGPDGGVASTLATYGYVNDGIAERPGRIATGTLTDRTETYSYGATNFSSATGGTTITQHTYDDGERVTGDQAPFSSNLTFSWNLDAGCPSGAECCGEAPVGATTTSTTSQAGSGDGGVLSLVTENLSLKNSGQQYQPRLLQTTDSCGGSYSCSPGTTRTEWVCSADAGFGVGYEAAFKNKRDDWEVYSWGIGDAGTGFPVREKRGVARGATDKSGTGALESESMSYVYGTAGQQLLSTTSWASLISGDAGLANWYDGSSRLWKVTRSGSTRDFQTQSPVPEVIATFYIATRSCDGSGVTDALGRTLETHGPCVVSSEGANDCSAASSPNFPVTTYEYYTSGTYLNRLKAVHRYINGHADCGGTPLTTSYDTYDVRGNATQVTDEAGNATTYTFDTAGNVLTRTKGGYTTQFAYDNGKLSRITYPAGNAEYFCYRIGAAAGCTSGGTWTPQLQWKAKVACIVVLGQGCVPNDYWQELVAYSYAADGTVAREDYRACPGGGCTSPSDGERRRVVNYSNDAQRRPTWRRTGDTAGQYVATSFFDRADNLAGVGLPFNNPPAFCGGPSSGNVDVPASTLCAQLTYDTAERLSSFTEYPDGGAQRTCFGHDGHGNVTRVTPGCTSSCNSDGTCSGGTSMLYAWDDFGNLISSQLGPSATLATYQHDARGNVQDEQNGAQRTAGDWLVRAYDGLGRPTSLSSHDAGTLWQLSYDLGLMPVSCGISQPNTAGRLAHRQDGLGDTYYSYDVEGRVTAEQHILTGNTGCATGSSGENDILVSPKTSWTYDSNGNPTTVMLPLGRALTYNYLQTGNRDRVSSIDVQRREADGGWSTKRLIDGVEWEPYGGLRRYQAKASNVAFDGGTDFTVEYMLGDNGTVLPAITCSSTAPSPGNSDFTGRVRALFVTSGADAGLGQGSGDIYRRWYTYQADVPTFIESCLLGESTSRVVLYGYDNTLRLTTPFGSYPAGPTGSESFSYDTRGNRASSSERGLSTSYTFGVSDSVDSYSSLVRAADKLTRGYAWDHSSRATQVTESLDGGSFANSLAFDYSYAAGATFKAAQVGGLWYNYGYDAFNRRVRKVKPSGVSEEYFYDDAHLLLGDRGYYSSKTGAALDDFIWLGGRPVAMARGGYSTSHARLPDSAATCLDEAAGFTGCGFFFIVTDVLGAPVVAMDSNGRVTGTNDGDPFGYPNRGQLLAQTPHPYPNNQSGLVIGSYQLANAGTSKPLAIATSVKFALMDVIQDGDSLALQTGSATVQTPVSQSPQATWSTPLPVDAGTVTVNVVFSSNTSGTAQGVVAEAFDYRRYEPGVVHPFFPKLRFPGQVYDAETDLFENWNRYYDPFTGRYLQPDSVLQRPGIAQAYAYAGNSPLAFADPDANFKAPHQCTNWSLALDAARRQAGCGGASTGGTKKSCRCQQKLKDCSACDICQLLDEAYLTPAFSVEDLQCAGKSSWGCSYVTTAGKGELDVDRSACEDPSKAGQLAKTLIHEATHFCKALGGGAITDEPGTCSAKSIAEECSK